eukprot:24175-Chlamydomonas_euryale.AAC.1
MEWAWRAQQGKQGGGGVGQAIAHRAEGRPSHIGRRTGHRALGGGQAIAHWAEDRPPHIGRERRQSLSGPSVARLDLSV